MYRSRKQILALVCSMLFVANGCASHRKEKAEVCGHCDYSFSNNMPTNPCDPCVNFVNLPCNGYTPTCWSAWSPDCPACVPCEGLPRPELAMPHAEVISPPPPTPAGPVEAQSPGLGPAVDPIPELGTEDGMDAMQPIDQ